MRRGAESNGATVRQRDRKRYIEKVLRYEKLFVRKSYISKENAIHEILHIGTRMVSIAHIRAEEWP